MNNRSFTVGDDQGFNNVDLSGSPAAWREVVEAEGEQPKPDPFEQAHYVSTPAEQRNALATFLTDIPDDAVAQAAHETGDPALMSEWRDQQAIKIARQFLEVVGDKYYRTDANFEQVVHSLYLSAFDLEPKDNVDEQVLGEELLAAGYWTVDNLVAVATELYDTRGFEDYPDGTYRPLTPAMWEKMTRLALAGQPIEAVAFGFRMALGLSKDATDATYMLYTNKPEYRGLTSGLVWHVWKAGSPDFDSRKEQEFLAFAKEYAGDRPFTFQLLTSAWEKFPQFEDTPTQAEPEYDFNNPETYRELNDEQLYSVIRAARNSGR